MNTRVVCIATLPNHALTIIFSNGEQRQMDMRPYLAYAVFDRLKDPSFFALAQADHGTVTWPGGIDIDPDSAFLESLPMPQGVAA